MKQVKGSLKDLKLEGSRGIWPVKRGKIIIEGSTDQQIREVVQGLESVNGFIVGHD